MALGIALTVRVTPKRCLWAEPLPFLPPNLRADWQLPSQVCSTHSTATRCQTVMGGQKMNRTGLAPALKELRIYWYVEGMGGLK